MGSNPSLKRTPNGIARLLARTLEGMRKVVDSNMLRDPVLGAWLRRSESNVAVLTDYLAMEALKGNALVGARKSMEILAGFPEQVAILKSTTIVCGLPGVSRGMQSGM